MKSRKPKAKSGKSRAVALPPYLAGVPHLLPSYAGLIAVNQSDGGHAALSASPQLKALCKPLRIPVTQKPVSQQGAAQILGVMYDGLLDGLTINKCSLAAGGTEPLTSLRRVDHDKIDDVFFSVTRPVLNILPSGATKPPKPKVTPYAITVLGMSPSVIPWVWLATVAAVAFSPERRRDLLAKGQLASEIRWLLMQHVAKADDDRYFHDILKWKPDRLNAAAAAVAKAASGL